MGVQYSQSPTRSIAPEVCCIFGGVQPYRADKNERERTVVSDLTPDRQRATEGWVPASWDEFLQVQEEYVDGKNKCYYSSGKLKIEMAPFGHDHASDHALVAFALQLYAALKDIPLSAKDNCTYQKLGVCEIQPDLSFYIGGLAEKNPWGEESVDLNQYPPPSLVVEIADKSLPDEQGEKRLLYEELNVNEYWIVDVQNVRVLAFAVADGGSRKILASKVLPGLAIAIIEDILRRSRQVPHSRVCAWLMEQLS